MSKKSKKKAQKTKAVPVKQESKSDSQGILNNKWLGLILFILGFALYSNTLGHDYTQDDAIVIYDNMFTQEGVSGIPGILTNDTFFGFFKESGKAKLVSGGRYRPFTLMMFALEWQIFGRNPMVGHLVNGLLYALLGFLIYKLLTRLFVGRTTNPQKQSMITLAFLASLIFVVHPIHTEAVANIKGRDEIMTMLGSIIALLAIFKFHDSKKQIWNLLAFISFFIALMSKENAITFLAVVPLCFLLFTKKSFGQSFKYLLPFIGATIIFLGIRFSILGADFGGAPNELMNNPFLKLSGNAYVPFSFGEKLATIFFTLGKYILLLFVPHPLSHDYYPKSVDMMTFGNWQALLSLATYIALIFCAFYFWTKDRFISFGILFYLITLSIVSNIVFPIGTNMSERFLFLPSLGFAIVFVRIIQKLIKKESLLIGLIGLIAILFSIKTVTRNAVWKDDFTLFTTDVKTQTRSAKLLNAAGGALSTKASVLNDGPEKTKYLNQAIGYLNKAVEIHPTYRNAYLLLANSHYYLKEYQKSINYYDQALAYDPNFKDALVNLPIVLRDGGKHMGQTVGDLDTAIKWLLRSYQLNSQDYETSRVLGVAYGIKGNHQKAVEYFGKSIAIKPDLAINYTSMGTAYKGMGNEEKAREYYEKALELDPKALDHLKK